MNLQKTLHFVYRNIKQIPYYKMYRQPEVRDLLAPVMGKPLRTFRDGQNAFVTSLGGLMDAGLRAALPDVPRGVRDE